MSEPETKLDLAIQVLERYAKLLERQVLEGGKASQDKVDDGLGESFNEH